MKPDSLLTKESLTARLKKYFDRNAHLFHVETALLYGSWAMGLPRQDSDVDIGIVFEDEGMPEGKIYGAINTISLSLTRDLRSEINILPVYHDFRKPMLYYNVIVQGIPVYISDYNKYLALRSNSINQMEDFEIFGKKWQLIIARKNLTVLENA